ncbi:hypothetical protein PSTT_14190 [Puccinia striiformis]|uniref:Uncharacterized protein n=1 Tax=Puccinia striiformis TaxID=27350 RepID=A0A2S4UNI3_9BASI|nr:hypothetical protein PSTT_14190 [Puccinia striiformis]
MTEQHSKTFKSMSPLQRVVSCSGRPELAFHSEMNGFNGVVECAEKATCYHHYTLPSSSSLSHPCLVTPVSFQQRLKRLCKE